MNLKIERYKKYGAFVVGCWFVALVILIGFLLVWIINAEAQTVIFRTEFQTVQGSDDLWYIQCLQGCDEFFNVAPIDQLYTGQPTDWQAMNRFKELEAAYLGLGFVPLPPPATPVTP